MCLSENIYGETAYFGYIALAWEVWMLLHLAHQVDIIGASAYNRRNLSANLHIGPNTDDADTDVAVGSHGPGVRLEPCAAEKRRGRSGRTLDECTT